MMTFRQRPLSKVNLHFLLTEGLTSLLVVGPGGAGRAPDLQLYVIVNLLCIVCNNWYKYVVNSRPNIIQRLFGNNVH